MRRSRNRNPLILGILAVVLFQCLGIGTTNVVGETSVASPLKQRLLEGRLGFRDVLVVQRRPVHTTHVYTYHEEGFLPGGGLYVYSPATGRLRELVASPEGMIIDCDLSYDGKEVVFSWKRKGVVMTTPLNFQVQECDRSNSDANYQVYRINIDGTGLKQLTRGTSNNLNACWLPDGGIAFISDRKPAYAYCFVTTSPVLYRVDGVYGNGLIGPYETPYPIDARSFLVSRNGDIEIRDYDGKDCAVLLSAKGDLGFYNAQPVRSRPKPPVIPSSLPNNPSGPTATIMMANVYQGLEGYVQKGEIKQIAVVQDLEKSTFTPLIHDVPFAKGYAANTAFGYQFPLVSCGATYSPKKVWGYANVTPDGAACFKVPAGVPIYFMALDKYGRAVQRMRTFTHLMPGEVQGCVGCHADRNSVTASPHLSRQRLAECARQPQRLTPPSWGVKGFSYLEVVQPVLDRYCVRCHNARTTPVGVDLSGDQTDFFNVSYDILARKGTLGELQPGVHNVAIDSHDEGRQMTCIAAVHGNGDANGELE